jgi:hypothetical protein
MPRGLGRLLKKNEDKIERDRRGARRDAMMARV